MFNKIFSTLFLLVFISLPAAVWAKDFPPGKWWHSPQVTKKLNLSDKEIQMLDKQFVDSRRKLIKLKSAVESERFELDFLFDRENINKKKVMSQFDKFQEAKNSLAVERFLFLFEVRKIIGLERFRQLKEFKQLRRQNMRKKLKSMRGHPNKEPGSE